jgi:hypothetical protein
VVRGRGVALVRRQRQPLYLRRLLQQLVQLHADSGLGFTQECCPAAHEFRVWGLSAHKQHGIRCTGRWRAACSAGSSGGGGSDLLAGCAAPLGYSEEQQQRLQRRRLYWPGGMNLLHSDSSSGPRESLTLCWDIKGVAWRPGFGTPPTPSCCRVAALPPAAAASDTCTASR